MNNHNLNHNPNLNHSYASCGLTLPTACSAWSDFWQTVAIRRMMGRSRSVKGGSYEQNKRDYDYD